MAESGLYTSPLLENSQLLTPTERERMQAEIQRLREVLAADERKRSQPLVDADTVWLPVVGYEGLYEASSCGSIRSLDRQRFQHNGSNVGPRKLRGRLLSQYFVLDYPKVSLCKNGKARQYFVHGLVCEAFHGPRPPGMQVAHGDGFRRNCRAENLRWATPQENIDDQILHGSRCSGVRHHSNRLTVEEVRAIRGRTGPRNDLAMAREFGVSDVCIRRVIERRTWKHI